ncbi:MAG: AAA family ATPase [Ignavibacterium sp.]|nr:AAA family ATPase [Ignavibacterium sp.]MDW8376067.1 AAA family ATPase [Ignavibacteriales bacterium]
MRIKKVYIKNYRSIKELDFEPQSLCALVGENNSGKSNILNAIDLILGESWPSIKNISDDDIYKKNINQDIEIKIWFDQPLKEDEDATGKRYTINGFLLRYSHYKRTTGRKQKGEPKIDFICIDEDGNEINIIKRLQKGKRAYSEPLLVNSEIRDMVPVVYIGVNRNLEYHLSGSRWTLLGKLLIDIEQEFKSDATKSTDFKNKIQEINQLLKIPSFNNLETLIKQNVIKQTGMAEVDIRFSEPSVYDHYKNLKLILKETPDYDEINALEMGSGIQSAIVIAIINAYREIKRSGAILIIEEPEVFLHPQTRRYFYSLLKSLSESGNQIFYSTHSTEFVRLEDYKNICIVRKNPADGTKVIQAHNLNLASNEQEELKLLTEFDSGKNEMFFARKVLLVEGSTEKYSLPYVFKLMGIDINEKGISIIDSGSKENLLFFIKILKAFKIPFVALHDEDKNANNYNNYHQNLNNKIAEISGDNDIIFRIDPDYEGAFNIKNQKRKVLAAQKKLYSIKDLNEIPDIIKVAINKLLNL